MTSKFTPCTKRNESVIRVIYKWRVEKANQSKFIASWKRATTVIRETIDGARGSVLHKSQSDPSIFVSIARWNKHEDWQAFWNDTTHHEMDEMHALAERISVDACEEIGDYTL